MAGSSRPCVLVLDAQLRHSLAIVRSLGRRGIAVVCVSPARRYPAKYSRYAARSYVISYPPQGSDGVERLLAIVEHEGVDVVVPAGLPGNEFICRHRQELEPHVRAPYNALSSFEQLSNKEKSLSLARSLGVDHPRTLQVDDLDRLDGMDRTFTYPVVFKSAADQGTVRYARTPQELHDIGHAFWETNPSLIADGVFPLVQEYVEGEGHGYYALADHGKILTYFMHRRLHEVPPSGGPSAMATSYRDPVLRDLGERFFAQTGWNGVAMVEFKRSRRDGKYYLLEVNPKFWGSLDLSIAAGVDFPYLLYRMLARMPLETSLGAYHDDYVFRWLTMDLAHAVQTRRIGTYFRTFARRDVRDDFSRRDLLPLLMLFATGVSRELRSRFSSERHV
jgi:predicted ATP-grasp superfamily ATP-dependent carboligase